MSLAFVDHPKTSAPRFIYHAYPSDGTPEFASSFRSRVEQLLFAKGVCLLRGAGIDGAETFESFVASLGFEFDHNYVGGAAPRSRIKSAVFKSTEADPSLIIGFHIEQCYQRVRPSMIAFYCESAPAIYGETPVFDAARVYDNLPSEIQRLLTEHGVEYRRFFPIERGRHNFLKTWMDAFGVSDRTRVEEILAKDHIQFDWQTDGSLVTIARTPAVVVDPASGRRCLNINMYETFSWPYIYERHRERFSATERRRLVRFMQMQTADPTPFLQTRLGDGRAFSQDESESIQEAIWNNMETFTWRRGDVLLINNTRYGHGRLNVVGERELYAILASPYDVQDVSANWFERRRARVKGR